MRAHPPLWRRYWRVVLVQVAVTLVAGGVVFWVGKRGADEWRDVFGAEAPLAEVAPATSSAPATLAASQAQPTDSKPSKAKAPPATPPPTAEKTANSVRSSIREALKKAKVKTNDAEDDDEDQGEEEEADEAPAAEENTNSREDAVEKEIEAAVDQISRAPRSERGKVASQSVARAIARVKEATSNASRRAERAKGRDDPKGLEQRGGKRSRSRPRTSMTAWRHWPGAHALATAPPSDYRKAPVAGSWRIRSARWSRRSRSPVPRGQASASAGAAPGGAGRFLTARAHEPTSRRLGAPSSWR
jgi:hypothetical protein